MVYILYLNVMIEIFYGFKTDEKKGFQQIIKERDMKQRKEIVLNKIHEKMPQKQWK